MTFKTYSYRLDLSLPLTTEQAEEIRDLLNYKFLRLEEMNEK